MPADRRFRNSISMLAAAFPRRALLKPPSESSCELPAAASCRFRATRPRGGEGEGRRGVAVAARSYINRAVGGIQQRRQRASRRVTSFSSRYNTMTGTLWHSSCSRAFMMLLHVAGRHYTCIYMHAFSRRYDVILIILLSEFIELLMNFKLQAAILNNAVRHSNLFLA